MRGGGDGENEGGGREGEDGVGRMRGEGSEGCMCTSNRVLSASLEM